MSQTFEDVRQAALARVAEFTDQYPLGQQVPYRRIGVRQQQLYAIAAHESAEYAGQCATGTVDSGIVDLGDIVAPIAAPERITFIEIATLASDSPYAVGDRVTVVSAADRDGVAPRAYLRNNRLIGIQGELDTIATVRIFYPYRPEPTASDEDGTRVVEMPDPHSELLVVDLARNYIQKMLQLDGRADIVALFTTEEAPLLVAWRHHVAEFAPLTTRFRQPPQERPLRAS